MILLRFAAGSTALGAMVCPVRLALGQDSAPRFTLASYPSPLTEGALGWLLVRPNGTDSISGGEAEGESLRFEQSCRGSTEPLLRFPSKAVIHCRSRYFWRGGGASTLCQEPFLCARQATRVKC